MRSTISGAEPFKVPEWVTALIRTTLTDPRCRSSPRTVLAETATPAASAPLRGFRADRALECPDQRPTGGVRKTERGSRSPQKRGPGPGHRTFLRRHDHHGSDRRARRCDPPPLDGRTDLHGVPRGSRLRRQSAARCADGAGISPTNSTDIPENVPMAMLRRSNRNPRRESGLGTDPHERTDIAFLEGDARDGPSEGAVAPRVADDLVRSRDGLRRRPWTTVALTPAQRSR